MGGDRRHQPAHRMKGFRRREVIDGIGSDAYLSANNRDEEHQSWRSREGRLHPYWRYTSPHDRNFSLLPRMILARVHVRARRIELDRAGRSRRDRPARRCLLTNRDRVRFVAGVLPGHSRARPHPRPSWLERLVIVDPEARRSDGVLVSLAEIDGDVARLDNDPAERPRQGWRRWRIEGFYRAAEFIRPDHIPSRSVCLAAAWRKGDVLFAVHFVADCGTRLGAHGPSLKLPRLDTIRDHLIAADRKGLRGRRQLKGILRDGTLFDWPQRRSIDAIEQKEVPVGAHDGDPFAGSSANSRVIEHHGCGHVHVPDVMTY